MIKVNEEELMIFGMEAANDCEQSDQAFDITTSQDDERNFDNWFLQVCIKEGKISYFDVLNTFEDEDFEDSEAPKLTFEEELHIKEIINNSINLSQEAHKELGDFVTE